MLNDIRSRLIQVDNVCDYIPFVSTLTNLVDLFQQCVIFSNMSLQSIAASSYHRHLYNKSTFRCIALLVPVIGNIVVGFFDFADSEYDNKEFQKRYFLSHDPSELKYVSSRLKDDKEFMLYVHRMRGTEAVWHASKLLKDDEDFVFATIRSLHQAGKDYAYEWKHYASTRLQNDEEFKKKIAELPSLQRGQSRPVRDLR